MANGTQLASDNFTRGAYPVLVGANSDGWTTISAQSALNISSASTVQPSAINTNCGAIWTGLAWPADQYSEYTLGVAAVATADVSLYVRCSADGTNAYRADLHSTNLTVSSIVSSAATTIINLTGLTVTVGDVFRLMAIGQSIIVTQNDRQIGFASSATVASGSAGIFIYDQLVVGNGTITSWRGGQPAGNVDGIWTKRGLVLPAVAADYAGGGIPGASNPTLLHEGNAQILSGTVFKMWFQGGGNGIFYAESLDGLSWTRKATAVQATTGIPKIFKNGSTYYLHVTHAPNVWTQIDQYTSSDGITWSLAHANILAIGGVGTWDHNFVGYFQVLAIIGGTWHALYQGSNGTQAASGHATSPDGVTWTKDAGNPVISTWDGGADQAILIGSTYYVWLTQGFTGQATGPGTSIVRFKTADFVTWTKDVVSMEPDNTVEGRNYPPGQISVSSVIQVTGNTYQFYCASVDDPGAGIFQIYTATAPYTVAQIVQGQEYFAKFAATSSDNFTRANGGLGANWTTITGRTAPQIATNLVEPGNTNVGGTTLYTAASFHNDQYSEITLSSMTANGFMDPVVRGITSAATFYGANLGGATGSSFTSLYIYKVVAGSLTRITPMTTITPQVGDVFRLSAVGTDISFFQNGNMLLQASDSAITSGTPGFDISATAAVTNAKISLWAGGNADASLPAFAAGNAGSLRLRRRRRPYGS